MIFSFIFTSTVKHSRKGTVFELGFKKSLFLKSEFFLILVDVDDVLFAFRQILLRCSSNFNVKLNLNLNLNFDGYN